MNRKCQLPSGSTRRQQPQQSLQDSQMEPKEQEQQRQHGQMQRQIQQGPCQKQEQRQQQNPSQQRLQECPPQEGQLQLRPLLQLRPPLQYKLKALQNQQRQQDKSLPQAVTICPGSKNATTTSSSTARTPSTSKIPKLIRPQIESKQQGRQGQMQEQIQKGSCQIQEQRHQQHLSQQRQQECPSQEGQLQLRPLPQEQQELYAPTQKKLRPFLQHELQPLQKQQGQQGKSLSKAVIVCPGAKIATTTSSSTARALGTSKVPKPIRPQIEPKQQGQQGQMQEQIQKEPCQKQEQRQQQHPSQQRQQGCPPQEEQLQLRPLRQGQQELYVPGQKKRQLRPSLQHELHALLKQQGQQSESLSKAVTVCPRAKIGTTTSSSTARTPCTSNVTKPIRPQIEPKQQGQMQEQIQKEPCQKQEQKQQQHPSQQKQQGCPPQEEQMQLRPLHQRQQELYVAGQKKRQLCPSLQHECQALQKQQIQRVKFLPQAWGQRVLQPESQKWPQQQHEYQSLQLSQQRAWDQRGGDEQVQEPQQQVRGKTGSRSVSQQAEQIPHQQQPSPKVMLLQQELERGKIRGKSDGSQTLFETESSQIQHIANNEAFVLEKMQKVVQEVAVERQDKKSRDSSSLVPPLIVKLKRTLGTKGRKISMETNHLPLLLGNNKQAVHYDVSITPDKPKTLFRDALLKFQQKFYPTRYPAFDGIKNLYSAHLLPFGMAIEGEVEVKSSDDDRIHSFKIVVKWVADVDLTVLHTYLKTDDQRTLDSINLQKALQCVDIVLRSAPSMTSIPVGRSYFTEPINQVYLGEGMGLYHGFYLSAILGWKPYVNVDVAHKAFPIAVSIIELIERMFGSKDPMEIMTSRKDSDYEALQKFLKGLKIEYSIPSQRNATIRVYKVIGLGECSSRARFKKDDGNVISVEEYFFKDKNYRLRFPHLFTLWVGNEKREQRILFPAELCRVVKNQVVNRKLTENQVKNMIKDSSTDTKRRKANIQRCIAKGNFNQSKCVQEFGFHVSDQFEKVQARILDPPKIVYGQNTETSVRKGVWFANTFSRAATIANWTILNLDRYVRPDDLIKLGKEIVRHGQKLGMSINAPYPPYDNLSTLRMREVQNKFMTYKSGKKQLVIVIIPNNPEAYSVVKKAAELEVGCLTQCIKSLTLKTKLTEATVVNILLKINAKCNGVNHKLCQRTFPQVLTQPCMIMGADVTHPGADAKNIPSVVAVTASFEPNVFRYNITWRLQPPKVEIIADLEAITHEHLYYFYKHNNGTKPRHIVFYRDGVSDGQFPQVLHEELKAIQNACRKIQTDYEPHITFLVVQKRHHTRFFPVNPTDSEDRNCNVPAGTCLDTHITDFRAQDFYLVSHASIQGVARPTKYRTLHDDLDLHEDDLEQLTFYLCHMFARCTRSVSYPAPTYYAHLAAARAKVYLENRPLNIGLMNDPKEVARYLENEKDKIIIKEEIVKGLPMFFV